MLAAATVGPGGAAMFWPMEGTMVGAVAIEGRVIDMEVVVIRGFRVPDVMVMAA